MRTSEFYYRRGSAYLAIVGVSMVVAVIGMSTLLAARIQRRAAGDDNSLIEAGLAARAAVEMGLYWAAGDPNWRSALVNDTWTPELVLGNGRLTWKFTDEYGGDLTRPVRLSGKGVAGNAVRIYSVEVQTNSGVNLLNNGDMESGTASWTGWGYCTLLTYTDYPHGGARYIQVNNRYYTWAGPNQVVTGVIEKNASYYTEAWVRMKSKTEAVKITFHVNSTGSGDQWFSTSSSVAGTAWTRISGTLQPTWNGTLNAAEWYVATPTSTQDFRVDDVLLRKDVNVPNAALVPGTWRRDVLP